MSIACFAEQKLSDLTSKPIDGKDNRDDMIKLEVLLLSDGNKLAQAFNSQLAESEIERRHIPTCINTNGCSAGMTLARLAAVRAFDNLDPVTLEGI